MYENDKSLVYENNKSFAYENDESLTYENDKNLVIENVKNEESLESEKNYYYAEMKNLLKGQIPKEYWLDYSKTFCEQTAKIYKKLIPELKKLISGHYNLSLKHLLRNVLDPEAEYIQHVKKQQERIYDDDIYFMSNKPLKNAPEWTLNKAKMYETDETNETNNINFLLNLAEINLIRPEDLNEIGESSTTIS
ncbi:hypothetical protein RhiirA4_481327 [Rhizophagus irregularis]|uniref:Uncharacterized protein n=1 Tax=Rhizophagus irregularis TaxID=588596 RepID=A0A2I1HJC4_9GLOM|nr:hypothetical protein RhiirA4_481327 [Rhizophagus irregularis]